MTYYRSRAGDLVPWIEEHNVGTMTNAASRWSESKDRFLDLWIYDAPQIVDSGGYNVQVNYGTEYPWSVKQYNEWLNQYGSQIEWAAVMDFACEHRFDDMWGKEERIEATLRNTIRQFELDREYQLLPVLQGRTIDDYITFYEKLSDHGIPTDYVGLGTVCRLSNSQEIVEVERALRSRTNIEKIHGFGVKIDAFKRGVYFESADSQAWAYYPTNGHAIVDFGESLEKIESDNARMRTVQSFKNYYKYASMLKQKARKNRQRGGRQYTLQDSMPTSS